jgi:hypothetical protein
MSTYIYHLLPHQPIRIESFLDQLKDEEAVKKIDTDYI